MHIPFVSNSTTPPYNHDPRTRVCSRHPSHPIAAQSGEMAMSGHGRCVWPHRYVGDSQTSVARGSYQALTAGCPHAEELITPRLRRSANSTGASGVKSVLARRQEES